MGVNVVAFFCFLDHAAYIHAVFDCGIPFGEVRQGNLVSDGNIVPSGNREVTVVFCDDGEQFCAGLHTLDYNDTDIVTPVMN
jgi:hypothetical protein|tara:strand:- start:601 stop:846 length:246 start_codon:yes stop_codon:yes gene_type:complete